LPKNLNQVQNLFQSQKMTLKFSCEGFQDHARVEPRVDQDQVFLHEAPKVVHAQEANLFKINKEK